MVGLVVLSGIAALWLLSATENGVAGSWANWVLFGIVLFWLALIVRMRARERRITKRIKERREKRYGNPDAIFDTRMCS